MPDHTHEHPKPQETFDIQIDRAQYKVRKERITGLDSGMYRRRRLARTAICLRLSREVRTARFPMRPW